MRWVGRKLTVTEQVRPGARFTQAAGTAAVVKGPVAFDAGDSDVTVPAMVPEFFTVTVWLLVVLIEIPPKETVEGDSENVAAAPVPLSDTLVGLPAALCGIVSVALRVPVACGVNFTVIAHEPFGATAVVHVLALTV